MPERRLSIGELSLTVPGRGAADGEAVGRAVGDALSAALPHGDRSIPTLSIRMPAISGETPQALGQRIAGRIAGALGGGGGGDDV